LISVTKRRPARSKGRAQRFELGYERTKIEVSGNVEMRGCAAR